MHRLTNLYTLLLNAIPFERSKDWVLVCRVVSIRMIIALCSLTCYTVAKDSDSVKFKPRDYTPSKTLHSNTYEPKIYAPKPHTPTAQFEGKSAENKTLTNTKSLSNNTLTPTKSLSDNTLPPQTPFTGKSADKQAIAEAKKYTQGEADFPSTISIDKTLGSQEKKPFLVSTNNSPFIVTERPKEKNPLLEPRQGIKAPEETIPTKDQTK